jgi:hypothetical protein
MSVSHSSEGFTDILDLDLAAIAASAGHLGWVNHLKVQRQYLAAIFKRLAFDRHCRYILTILPAVPKVYPDHPLIPKRYLIYAPHFIAALIRIEGSIDIIFPSGFILFSSRRG